MQEYIYTIRSLLVLRIALYIYIYILIQVSLYIQIHSRRRLCSLLLWVFGKTWLKFKYFAISRMMNNLKGSWGMWAVKAGSRDYNKKKWMYKLWNAEKKANKKRKIARNTWSILPPSNSGFPERKFCQLIFPILNKKSHVKVNKNRGNVKHKNSYS